jgi:hypothetical protein
VKHDDKRPDLDRFRAVVDSYGANPTKWPEGERQALEKLASSEEARAWLVEQGMLDAWLDGAEEMAPTPALLRRVAEIPVRHAAPAAGWVWPFGRLRSIVGAAAAVAAVGMVVGMTTPDNGSDDGGDEWDELSTLALGADLAEVP